MPTWKISGYRFYFHSGEPLKKHKSAHIHVRGAKHGKIQFWLKKPDQKTKEEITVKKIKGQISDKEKNEIEKIVIKNKKFIFRGMK